MRHRAATRLVVVAVAAVALLAGLAPGAEAAAAEDSVRFDLSPRRAWDHRGVRYRVVNDAARNLSMSGRYLLEERRRGEWDVVNAPASRKRILVEADDQSRPYRLHRCRTLRQVCTKGLRTHSYRLTKSVYFRGDNIDLRLRFRVRSSDLT